MKAILTGHLACPSCHWLLEPFNDQLRCNNRDCKHHNTPYRQPRIKLKRVKETDSSRDEQ